MGLDVRTAKVSTLTDRAHDVFYVVEGSGGKVTSQERKNEIAQALLAQARHPVEVPAGT
jgi:UTP:GlnB (protein PII) uridylyltransferase